MTPFPLVSIVTPSFNQAAFLEQTICSVLRQDYPALEYMIVDGGSGDGSQEIIRRYQDRLTWWVSEPDGGQADGINKGLKRANGEIVAWLNSDDLFLPGAIHQAVQAFQKAPDSGFVYGDALSIDEHGRLLNLFAFDDLDLLDLISFRIICQPAVFMRRRILEQAGFLDPGYHYMLDHQLWVRIARIAPIQHIPASLSTGRSTQGLWAAARYHAGAKNVSQSAGFGDEIFKLLDWMLTQPELATLITNNQRRVRAGAYRLKGRYLLDGGLAPQALGAYLRALANSPTYAIKHLPRMLFAVFCLLNLDQIARPLIVRRTAHKQQVIKAALHQLLIQGVDKSQIDSSTAPSMANWPGINLNE